MFAAVSPEQLFEEQQVTYSGGDYQNEVFKYRLLKPAKIEECKRYPVVLFLHGSNGRGNDNARQLQYLPDQMSKPEWREKYPCFLLAPQCRSDKKWVEVPWEAKESNPQTEASDQMRVAIQILEKVMRENPVDPARVYMTGLSMGGYGTWDLAMRMPEKFAAVAPICGGGDERGAAKLVRLPIWAWHGEADNDVPVERSRAMIDAIKNAGGDPKYTELKGVGHDSWTPAYDNPNGVLPWLFSQNRERYLAMRNLTLEI